MRLWPGRGRLATRRPIVFGLGILSMNALIEKEFEAHRQTVAAVIQSLTSDMEAACRLAIRTFQQGQKLLLFGNGGSAADAQHIAAEFSGRFKRQRRGLPAIALTTDTSALTAIGNDFGFDRVFSRQVEALAQPGDLLVGFSTTGNSVNVNEALKLGKAIGCATLGFSGRGGGGMKALCDVSLIVPSDDTARIQEMHILLAHTLCQVSESTLFPDA